MTTSIYTSFENYKGGINNLIVVSDNYGNRGTSTKSPQAAYKNYLRNRKRNNKIKFAEDILRAERKAKKQNKEIQNDIKASFL